MPTERITLLQTSIATEALALQGVILHKLLSFVSPTKLPAYEVDRHRHHFYTKAASTRD